jgi:ADP-heptose:LPS heptosyltransferase
MTNLKDRIEIPLEYWDGKSPCNRLLIVSEQGLGDNIQYYRFIIELSNKYPEMKIIYFCKQEISHLFQTYKNIEIINSCMFFNYDYKLYLMSLPYILQLFTIVPNNTNYIRTNPDKQIYWKEKLDGISSRLKVGFVYNGLLSSFIEKHIPLKYFEILCDLDIDLICIHRKSDLEKDVIQCDKIRHFDIDTEKPFEDKIHILQNIDLLITIDTFIVHLAGILNVKTWLLLGISEWRWSDDLDKSYWYNSVELIRTQLCQPLSDLVPIVKDKLSEYLIEKQEIKNNMPSVLPSFQNPI